MAYLTGEGAQFTSQDRGLHRLKAQGLGLPAMQATAVGVPAMQAMESRTGAAASAALCALPLPV